MDWSEQAKAAQDDTISVFTTRPGSALSTVHGAAVLRDGLLCTYEQDGHVVHVDMPPAVGGSGEAPTPGFFARAALCSCLAIGIRMTALREGVPITALKVSIDQDWDDRGLFALAGASAGPLDTRIAVTAESPVPRATIEALVERALACDPWFIAFRDAQKVRVTLAAPLGA